MVVQKKTLHIATRMVNGCLAQGVLGVAAFFVIFAEEGNFHVLGDLR